jgi:hypothetical protein
MERVETLGGLSDAWKNSEEPNDLKPQTWSSCERVIDPEKGALRKVRQPGVYASTAFATRWAPRCSTWDWIVTFAKQRWATVAMPPTRCTSAGAIVALQLIGRLLHMKTIWRLGSRFPSGRRRSVPARLCGSPRASSEALQK